MPAAPRKAAFIVLTALLVGAVVSSIVYLARPLLVERLQPQLVSYLARSLSWRERQEIYRLMAASFGNAWENVPEPDVGRLAKPDWTGVINRVEVRTNNAGMRSRADYLPKPAGVFRIVCLGDSFVFGGGAPVEDRFADQLEVFYRDRGIRVDDREIEVYAVGLGSWTLVQEATYLARRISEYDPDVVVLVAVGNDISEAHGVTGAGAFTTQFSAEARRFGNGVWHNRVNAAFGESDVAAVQWDLSPVSRGLWDKAMRSLGRLVELQQRRGGRILLSSLNNGGKRQGRMFAFTELFNAHVLRHGIRAPRLVVTYLSGDPGYRLAHDPHPNRAGHALLRDQYVHALHRLGWIPIEEGELPALAPGVAVELDRAPDPAAVDAFQASYVDRYLRESLDFGRLGAGEANSFLGGIFPGDEGTGDGLPWGTVRAGLLLRRPERWAGRLDLQIGIEPRPELFPFELQLTIDGRDSESFRFESPNATGRYTLSAAIPGDPSDSRVIEIVLETESYYARLEDSRMRSYQLISASAR